MPLTTDQIVSKLFDPARSLPPLEPGKTVYDKSLVQEIADLKENKFVIACEWWAVLLADVEMLTRNGIDINFTRCPDV
jgi:hypothetical protein